MIRIPITITEPSGISRKNEPVTLGIPFPPGKVKSLKYAKLVSSQQILPSQISISSYWPDGSVKWGLLDFQASLNSDEIKDFFLSISKSADVTAPNSNQSVNISNIKIADNETQIIVDTGKARFYINKQQLKPFDQVIINQKSILNGQSTHLQLLDENKTPLLPIIDHISISSQEPNSDKCVLKTTITINGSFQNKDGIPHSTYSSELNFYAEQSTVKWKLTIHNPNAAKHPNGLWDLGDRGSIKFNSLIASITLEDTSQILWKTDANSQWQMQEPGHLCIYQASSGGENWNSPNHKNAKGIIPLQFRGYQCTYNGEQITQGDRISPYIHISGKEEDNIGITVYADQFWQNFPTAIAVNKNQIDVSLFPDQYSETYELQGGEKKTHCIYLDFDTNENNLNWVQTPLHKFIDSKWLEASQAIPHFYINSSPDPLIEIINDGLNSENNFFSKREQLDEYGWRNFGDLYADHETEGHTGDEIFVSHYNNQYDPLYGFLRQYLLSCDQRWFELANDLAQHITDIDIYNTEKDRIEYNNGLFWHTDHYLDASTCSHRTFSKNHKAEAYDDYTPGGGPGGQHCYTSGLLYHYFLTGSDSSKQAVLKLTQWINYFYEGSGGFAETLLKIKNHNDVGAKNIFTGRYPLDRGIANYINALLDCYTLTGDFNYVAQVENIIQNTIHPCDNIDERNFDNPELTWFYIVFLQATGRYLETKEQIKTLDHHFYYARDCLIHYSNWMLKNEHPYLQKPELLEFPNLAWAAQDIRKANVFYLASYYTHDKKAMFKTKGNEFYNYVIETVRASKSRSHSRTLSILMQNHGLHNYFSAHRNQTAFDIQKNYTPPKQSIIRNVLISVYKSLKQFSLKKEINWLSHRSNRIAKLNDSRY